MNEGNYASLEASKRLMEARILVRKIQIGDRVCHITKGMGFVTHRNPLPVVASNDGTFFRCDPRTLTIIYSMGEVWRELPDLIGAGELRMARIINTHEAVLYYGWIDEDGKEQIETKVFRNTNPADALIDLLIFIKVKEHHHE